MSVAEYLRSRRTRATDTHSIYLDGELWAKARDLYRRIELAKAAPEHLRPDFSEWETQVQAMLEQLETSKVVFTFRTLSDEEQAELKRACPTDDTKLRYDPERFRVALVAEACIGVTGPDYESGGMSFEDAQNVLGDLLEPEKDRLIACAWNLSKVAAPEPFPFAPSTETTTSSGGNSTTASTKESLQAVS